MSKTWNLVAFGVREELVSVSLMASWAGVTWKGGQVGQGAPEGAGSHSLDTERPVGARALVVAGGLGCSWAVKGVLPRQRPLVPGGA